LVVNATADAAVPSDYGESIAAHLSDGYLINAHGGQHVMSGRGIACIDKTVGDFLVDGTRPKTRRIECQAPFADDFVPPPPPAVPGKGLCPSKER
jgi:hypothetical protein